MIEQVIEHKLKILLANKRCNVCLGTFSSGTILSDEMSMLQYSSKRFYSIESKQRHNKPVLNSFCAPFLKRYSKKPKSVFIRSTLIPAVQRTFGDSIIVILSCNGCDSEKQIEISTDNINNLCSK